MAPATVSVLQRQISRVRRMDHRVAVFGSLDTQAHTEAHIGADLLADHPGGIAARPAKFSQRFHLNHMGYGPGFANNTVHRRRPYADVSGPNSTTCHRRARERDRG